MKNLVVYLRHHNDIDHIVPVLYKWLRTCDIPVRLFLMDRRFLRDARIVFLRKYFKNIMVSVYNSFRSLVVDAGVVVFDWVMNKNVQRLIKGYQNRGVPVVSLPHGDSPYVNRLETVNALGYSDVRTNELYNLYDYLVVPNWLCERRYKDIMDDGKIRVLGSARYCDEWMGVHDAFIPGSGFDALDGFKSLVMYTRNVEYPIFWEEVARVIRILLGFEGVKLVVKRHSRSTGGRIVEHRICEHLPIRYRRNRNLVFTTDNDSLLVNADAVFDMGTSMSWEAVKKRVPVFCLDLVHCNRSTIAYYINDCLVDTRDKLVDRMNGLMEDAGLSYNDGKRDVFIREIIDVPDNDVLGHYVGFLEGLF